MRTSLVIFVCLIFGFKGKDCPVFDSKTVINPFDTLKYDKVIAYDYNGQGDRVLVRDGFLYTDLIKTKKELTKEQIAKLHQIISSPKTYGNSTAACFDPHLGFAYYLGGKIVGDIAVCLGCNYLKSSHLIPATQSHKTELCETCYAKGFSKKGRKQFSALCKELKFSHWELNSELFD